MSKNLALTLPLFKEEMHNMYVKYCNSFFMTIALKLYYVTLYLLWPYKIFYYITQAFQLFFLSNSHLYQVHFTFIFRRHDLGSFWFTTFRLVVKVIRKFCNWYIVIGLIKPNFQNIQTVIGEIFIQQYMHRANPTNVVLYGISHFKWSSQKLSVQCNSFRIAWYWGLIEMYTKQHKWFPLQF